MVTLRPSDANETVLSWRVALERRDGPTALVLTRQNLPVLDRTVLGAAEGLLKGGYVLKDAPGSAPEVILIATGSEVEIALAAADTAERRRRGRPGGGAAELGTVPAPGRGIPGIGAAAGSHRSGLLEAASTFGWDRYVGSAGVAIGIDHFGASAPAKVLYKEFGITAENMVATAHRVLGR